MAQTIPSRQTLDGVPARVLTFLIGLGTPPTVGAKLQARGYRQAEHDFAFNRLSKLSNLPNVTELVAETPVGKAVIYLDGWDETNMECIAAALDHLHPDQGTFVFNNLAPSQGKAAVIGVEILLNRLDQLETGQGREKATHKADLAAIATLEARGYTKAERGRLRELVNVDKTVTEAVPLSNDELPVVEDPIKTPSPGTPA